MEGWLSDMSSRPVYSTRFKVGAAVVVTLAVAAFVLAYLSVKDGSTDPIVSSTGAADAVEDLIPRRGNQVPQQSTVGIDLRSGWEAALSINGQPIPPDQLRVTPEIGLVEYTPGDGQAVEAFRPGENCVDATVWPVSEGRGGGSTRTVSWCFEVV